MTEEKDINVISDEVIAKTLKELSSRYIDRCVSEDFKKSGAEIYSLGVQDGIDVIMKMVTEIVSKVANDNVERSESITKIEETLKGLLN